MSLQTLRSQELLKISITLIIAIFLVQTVDAYTKKNTESDPQKSVASEKVGKILNVPVTLDFDDQPSMKRGFYGGHRSNLDVTDKPVDEGQFGRRIILGIVENIDETPSPSPAQDQKKSQTIVKYFDKEDYDGIKNPIVVEENYDENADIEKTRNRKEIIDLPRKTSFLSDDETDDEHSRIQTTTDERRGEPHNENEEYVEENRNENDKLTEEYENGPEENQEEITNDSEAYTETDDDSSKQNYEEKNKQDNQQKILIEENEPDETHNYKESNSEVNIPKHPSNKYIEQNEEENGHQDKKSDTQEGDQKESADHSHEEVKKRKKSGKHASGKGEEHKEEKHSAKGDKGEKKYEGYHEEVKKKKGHHDEVKHGNKYADKGGEEKKHHEEHGHHGNYHKGEEGEKGSKFSEEGKHSKGHSTKGEHNIHKKDEYEKKQEFYDEHHEGGEHEKHGKFHHEDQYEKGGHKKGGHHKKGDHDEHYGKKSHHTNGHFYDDKNGKKKSIGHNQHHGHHSKHGKKSGHSGKKHWGYKKDTGDGGHKKHNGNQEAAYSNLRQIKKIPKNVHENYREEGNKYPHYTAKIHVHNDNRRSDTVENKDDEIIDQKERKQPVPLKNENEPVNPDRENSKSQESDEQNEDQLDYSPQSTILHEKNRESPKNFSRSLPKIYVILPEDFEEQLQQSAENSESSSIERASSYEDSDEETPVSKEKIYNQRNKKVGFQLFPEDHRKRLSEIEYVVHKIGEDLEKNMKVKGPQI